MGLEPGHYTVEAIYYKKEIGGEGWGVILAYRGKEKKDHEELMKHILYSKEMSFNTEKEMKSFLERILKDKDIEILNEKNVLKYFK